MTAVRLRARLARYRCYDVMMHMQATGAELEHVLTFCLVAYTLRLPRADLPVHTPLNKSVQIPYWTIEMGWIGEQSCPKHRGVPRCSKVLLLRAT